MGLRTRKFVTMHLTLNPGDDVDRLNVSRKEGGRGYGSTEDSGDASIRRLENYIKNSNLKLMIVTTNNVNNTRISRTKITRKQKIGRKTTV